MKNTFLIYLNILNLKLIYILLALIVSTNDSRNIIMFQSEIKLVINGKGHLSFLNSSFF